MLLLAAPSLARATVDLSFEMDTDQWERNGVYLLNVTLTNKRAEAVKLAGVQADFTFNSAHFKEEPLLISDNITGFVFVVDEVDTKPENEGEVLYAKAISVASPTNYFTIPAGGDMTAVVLRLRVKNDAPLEGSDFEFIVGATVTERLETGETGGILGTAHPKTVTIVEDETPPDTYAIPKGRVIKEGDSTKVQLSQLPEPPYDDLEVVFYEVGKPPPPVSDPTESSSSVPADGFVQLPVNDAGHPEKITGVLKFFGRDNWGNLELSFNTETYVIDVIPPSVIDPVRSPERVKLDETITVEFSVDEPLQFDPEVVVNNNQFSMVSGYPDYTYAYNVQTGDAEGTRTITIKATDEVGNVTTDTSLNVIIDMTPPEYSPVSFLPEDIEAAQTLEIKFEASEELDTDKTKVYVAQGFGGGEAAFAGKSGLVYTYEYTVKGDEQSSFVHVYGYDLAGNSSWNTDDWNLIRVEGQDLYFNIGVGYSTVGIEWRREEY